jgi:hypothetical protein
MHLRFLRWLVALAKNSPWLMIAVGLHLILALAMSIAVIRHELKKGDAPPTSIEVAVHRVEQAALPPLAEEAFDRQSVPEQDRMVELVPVEDVQPFVPAATELPQEELFLDVGDLTGTDESAGGPVGGSGIGVGNGGWHGVPGSPFGGRPSGNGPGGLKPGRPALAPPLGTEEAVLEGLRWLVRHQDEDGSWGADTLTQQCDPRAPCIPPDAAQDATYNAGMTALALLAFLGRGLSLDSQALIDDPAMGRQHKAGDVVKRGVRWLLDQQRPDGSFSGSEPFEYPENETLSAMALCEAYGLSHIRELKRPAQDALDFLMAAQRRRTDGALSGWGQGSFAELEQRRARGEVEQAEYEEVCNTVDLSITCWVVMALRSAQNCGFAVPEEVLQGALSCVAPGGPRALGDAASGAQDPPHQAGRRAALVLLIRAFAGRDISDPALESAARAMAEDPPQVADGLPADFYYWYFATLALNQYDGPDSPRRRAGEYWEPWNKGLVRSLLPLQDDDQARGACSRGGWLSQARGNERGRALYNTALNVLTLEVYYRYENVFR